MAGTPQQPKQPKRGRAGQGQPTKCTPATLALLADAIEHGASLARACDAAGIGHQTLQNWRHDPRKGEEVERVIAQARARLTQRCMARILAAADDGNWQAAAWTLERLMPDEYGRRERQQVEHSGQVHTVVSYENDWKAPTNSDKQGTGAA